MTCLSAGPRGARARGARVLTPLLVAACLAGTTACLPECTSFSASLAEDAHGEATPEQAVQTWLADASGDLWPAEGWSQQRLGDASAVYVNGRRTLDVARVADGSWLVDEGSTC